MVTVNRGDGQLMLVVEGEVEINARVLGTETHRKIVDSE